MTCNLIGISRSDMSLYFVMLLCIVFFSFVEYYAWVDTPGLSDTWVRDGPMRGCCVSWQARNATFKHLLLGTKQVHEYKTHKGMNPGQKQARQEYSTGSRLHIHKTDSAITDGPTSCFLSCIIQVSNVARLTRHMALDLSSSFSC